MNPLALALVMAAPQTQGSIPMVFSGTEVGHALKAIGLRTGIGIVYAAGKERLDVTLNATANSPDEAIRYVASAAGLVVRKVNRVYVVALPSAMRQALEPYAVTTTLPVEEGTPEEMATRLQEILPYASVRASGNRIAITGTPDDVATARASLADLQGGNALRRPASDVVVLERAVPSSIAPLLTGLYPDVKIIATPGERPGGALALSGPGSAVESVRTMALRIDRESGVDGSTFRIYSLRYSSATSILDFLRQAAPNVEAFAGPEAYQPKRAVFNPLTAGVTGIVGASTGAGGAGSTGGSAISATSPSGTSLPTTPTGTAATTAGDRAKTLVIRGRAADVDAAFNMLAQVDRKPKQVVVEVNVFETSPELDSNVGLRYNWTTFNFQEAAPGSVVADIPLGTRPAGVGQFSRVPWNFNATLNALVTNRQAKILAQPSIRVVDDGQASVFIGDTIRARIVTGGALGAQNVEIQEFPVGIILLLAPRVNADGNITLHVNPVVSTVSSVDEFNVPQTSAREAETTAIVKDGETVVLGGLIRDEDIRTVQSVPLLSKLPLVGELFKNRVRNHRRSDIKVSITTHIIPDDEPLAAAPATPVPAPKAVGQ